jgi:hypothetical protein
MNLMNAVARTTYLPFCRAYSRYFVGNKAADPILGWFTSMHFWRTHGYWPQLKAPRSFDEKVVARMLYDRNPLWTQLSDKIRVRDYVADKVGSDILIPLLWTGRIPQEIPFDELPEQFVLKTNHGCTYTIIVKEKAHLDFPHARSKLRTWLNENFCYDYALGTAWAYRNICPAILIESFITDDGTVPRDYKFFCFNGKVEAFKLDFDRYTEHSVRFFDRECQPLDVHEVGHKPYDCTVELPHNMQEMIEVAERLAQGFDFIRVDLYSVKGRIFFGELTPYPGGGEGRWDPRSVDFLWGSKWSVAPYVAWSAENLVNFEHGDSKDYEDWSLAAANPAVRKGADREIKKNN